MASRWERTTAKGTGRGTGTRYRIGQQTADHRGLFVSLLTNTQTNSLRGAVIAQDRRSRPKTTQHTAQSPIVQPQRRSRSRSAESSKLWEGKAQTGSVKGQGASERVHGDVVGGRIVAPHFARAGGLSSAFVRGRGNPAHVRPLRVPSIRPAVRRTGRSSPPPRSRIHTATSSGPWISGRITVPLLGPTATIAHAEKGRTHRPSRPITPALDDHGGGLFIGRLWQQPHSPRSRPHTADVGAFLFSARTPAAAPTASHPPPPRRPHRPPPHPPQAPALEKFPRGWGRLQ